MSHLRLLKPKRQTPEHDLQVSLMEWAEWNKKEMPELELLYAIPNGGLRNVVVAAKLKAEGVKRGVPDLHWPIARGRYHSLYLELKSQGGKLSPEQRWWRKRLTEEGHAYFTPQNIQTAQNILTLYWNIK